MSTRNTSACTMDKKNLALLLHDLMNEVINPVQHLNPLDKTDKKVTVPTGVAQFKTDLLPPRTFAERYFNI